MESIGFQRLAVIFLAAIRPSERERQKSTAMEANRTRNAAMPAQFPHDEKQPLHGFVNDPDAGQKQESGFDESGEVLHFTVAVLVIGVGRFIREPELNRNVIYRRNQIEPGVRGLRQNSQTSRCHAYDDFQRGNGRGCEHGTARDRAFSARMDSGL